MICKIGINGISGRMGTEIAALLGEGFQRENVYLELADGVSRRKNIVSVEGVEVRTWNEPPREPVHLWMDFSQPEATLTMLEHIDTPVLIGTTGFRPDQLEKVRGYAEKHPVLMAANTSPGMSVVRQFVREVVPPTDWGFSAFVSEAHHVAKKDSPSGSALELSALLQQRGYELSPPSAIRAGGIVGEHTLRFVSEHEEVIVQHRVFNRAVFAKGALLAAVRFTSIEKSGLYTWDQVFKGLEAQ